MSGYSQGKARKHIFNIKRTQPAAALPPSLLSLKTYLASTMSSTKVLISRAFGTAGVGTPTTTTVSDAELGVALRAFGAT